MFLFFPGCPYEVALTELFPGSLLPPIPLLQNTLDHARVISHADPVLLGSVLLHGVSRGHSVSCLHVVCDFISFLMAHDRGVQAVIHFAFEC